MTCSLQNWKNCVAVVTGAASGIGEAIAKTLLKHDLKVVGFDRDIAKLLCLKTRLPTNGEKENFHPVEVDVTNEEDLIKSFKWVTADIGPVSILINNAGVIQETNLTQGNTEMWKKILDTNFLAVCITTREAVQIMGDYKIDGYILNIASVLGHASYPNFEVQNVYAASKAAVLSFSETLRHELNIYKSKVRVTCISPGFVVTKLFNSNSNDDLRKMLKSIPSMKPEDIADCALYCLSTPPHVQVQEIIIRPQGDPHP